MKHWERAIAGLIAVPTALVAVMTSFKQEPTYDLVIRNGWVLDGSGNPAIRADIGVQGAKIVKVGGFVGQGKEELDATGLYVTPGFIDVHTHAENITKLKGAENFVRMGVTSIVVGNCGGSEPSIGTFFKEIESGKAALNVASLVGHNTVRRAAMKGEFDRDPTTQELDAMRGMVEQAMKDGAVGLSTGLIYQPGTFSKTDEIIELAKVAAKYGGIYASHMRSEGLQILEAIQELIDVAKGAHIRAELSHVKLSGPAMWGKHDQVLEAIERARRDGVEITQDEYMYTASSTSLSQTIPDWVKEGGRAKFKERLAIPTNKAKVVADMKANLERNARKDYAYAAVASNAQDPSMNGKRIPEVAKAKRGSDSLDDQIEVLLDIHASGGASGVFHGMDEGDLKAFLQHPNTMIASDSGVRDPDEGAPHPRGYGNNARVLARYVRDEKIISLQEAIRKMTSLPAATFRIVDRGMIREGLAADLVVFDLAKVSDVATYDDPHHPAIGFRLVMVNGVPVVRDDKSTGALPGSPLRCLDGQTKAQPAKDEPVTSSKTSRME